MPNQPVHLTPKARTFFSLAISEQNFSFAKLSLTFGAGDQHDSKGGDRHIFGDDIMIMPH